jgi:hypothetical protein
MRAKLPGEWQLRLSSTTRLHREGPGEDRWISRWDFFLRFFFIDFSLNFVSTVLFSRWKRGSETEPMEGGRVGIGREVHRGRDRDGNPLTGGSHLSGRKNQAEIVLGLILGRDYSNVTAKKLLWFFL